MIRRPVWLGAGFVLGVGGTLWAERQVRKRVRRVTSVLSASGAGDELARSARALGERLRDAVEAGRRERRRSEHELWARLGEVPPARPSKGR